MPATGRTSPVSSPVIADRPVLLREKNNVSHRKRAYADVCCSRPPFRPLRPRASADQDDLARLKHLRDSYDTMRNEIGRVVIGQEAVIEQLLIAIFARGHCILVGVPGLAKTLLVSTLSRILSLSTSNASSSRPT